MKQWDYERIVTHSGSPMLVLAGPGAGKTHLLADRTKRLLEKGVSKSDITMLTFGVDAMKHMKQTLTDPEGRFQLKYDDLPHICTMHSLGLQILREKPRDVKLRKADLEVQEDEKVKRLLYRDASLILGYGEEVANEARSCKQQGDCREDPNEARCKICTKYWEIMSKCNRIDFDDQILFACRILENNQELLDAWQSKAAHLLVDEYQDINAAQFRLIELLSRSSRGNLFVVGDDAQSIYGFRGGDPRFILRFGKDFACAQRPPMACSRRCGENIMKDAAKVLKQYYRDWTGPYELEYHVPAGSAPRIWRLPSELSEAEMVARLARHFIGKKKTVLLLAPKKEFFPLISRKLQEYGVPHHCPGSLLPEQVEERLSVAGRFVDWLSDSSDSFLTRLIMEDLINVGAAKVPGATKARTCRPETVATRVSVETEVANLWESVDRNRTLYDVVRGYVGDSTTISKTRDALAGLLEAYSDSKGLNRGEFAKRLALVSGIWADASHLATDISCIISQLESRRPTGDGSVQLMSMKKAKGLEAHVVVIVGLEDDIVPNPFGDEAEEARLFYVSMTRAKEDLFLFHAFKRPRNVSHGDDLTDKRRSRFLNALGRTSEWKEPKKKKD